MFRLCFIVALLSLTSSVHSQEIFKCVEKGKVTYSQTPCTSSKPEKVLDYSNLPPVDPQVRAERAAAARAVLSGPEEPRPTAQPRAAQPARETARAPAEPELDRAERDNRRRECEWAREKLSEVQRLGGRGSAVNAEIANVNAACGTNTNTFDTIEVGTRRW